MNQSFEFIDLIIIKVINNLILFKFVIHFLGVLGFLGIINRVYLNSSHNFQLIDWLEERFRCLRRHAFTC